MQRLLGVERVVVYNQSISHRAGEVFLEYGRRQFDGVVVGDSDISAPFVEVRQTHGPLLGFESTYAHQTATINDCMYRNIGLFRHIAVMDFDELIVPRKTFASIPELIDHLSLKSKKTFGSFVFRNAHFFVNRSSGVGDDGDDVDRRLVAASQASLFSLYLTRQRRAAVSPPSFVVKSIIDADACVAMWVHCCLAYTERFNETKHGGEVVKTHDVDVGLALKHHYRPSCNFDQYRDFYEVGSCAREMNSSVRDDSIKKFGGELVVRLLKQYENLKL